MVRAWITYDNRIVSMENMTHQHMSNIHYYINWILPQFYDDTTRAEILEWLRVRFNGVILPYHPVPAFKEEKNYLESKGYLQGNNIVVNNQLIGSYE